MNSNTTEKSKIAYFLTISESLALLVKSKLWVQILIGMAAGITLGILISPRGLALVSAHTSELIAGWVSLPGYIFLALIQMIMMALIFSSIVLGVNSCGDLTQLKKLGGRIVPYFLITTMIAVSLGLLIATTIKPGTYVAKTLLEIGAIEKPLDTQQEIPVTASAEQKQLQLPKKLIEIIPANPLRSALEGSMLQIVIFSILVGVALISIRDSRSKPLLDLTMSLQEVAMKVVSWAMMIAPLAVFGLLAEITAKMGFDVLLGMGTYVATVLFGLMTMLLVYLVMMALFAKVSPKIFFQGVRELLLLAFSTSSSAAVMPLSIEVATQKFKVRESTANFVIPIGATINMDGTAIYQVIAAVFLAQVYGIDLSIPTLILLSFTAVGASIGSPSTPGVGIVVLATILGGIGVPVSGIALLIGVDRILDMCRTVINVSGDITACLVLDKLIPSE